MEVTRLFDLLPWQMAKYPQSDMLVGKENGTWRKYSTAEVIEQVHAYTKGLIALGIEPTDKVASISNNRPEWNILDHAILQSGGVHVSIYPTISENEYKFILNDCEAKVIVVSDEALYTKMMSIKKDLPNLHHLFTFDMITGAAHFTAISHAGKDITNEQVEQRKRNVKTGDLATLIYTSGTTGNPKGVMLTHNNIVANFLACRTLPPVDHHDIALSFLPLCHVYERMLTYLYMYIGVSIYYAESLEKIGDNIKEVKPHVFSAVPRLIEKVYDKIMDKGKAAPVVKRAIFMWAVNLGLQYELDGKNGWWYETKLKLARKLVFSKWREGLGNNVKCIVSGGAALQERLARIFWAAGIPILEGYGLSETSPVISVNYLDPGSTCFGTVGLVIENVQVKIAEDGEILCKGPSVMQGYYKRDDLTKEVIDNEGWLHTGDIGTMVANKYLKITDRKKEIFKTSGGKYIAPQPIENMLKASPFIENAMVIGENQKFASAIICPNFNNLKNWCTFKGINFTTPEEMIWNAEVIKKIDSEVEKTNSRLGQFEKIKREVMTIKEWTVASGELTPTLKLKRKTIFNNNLALIEKIYKDNSD